MPEPPIEIRAARRDELAVVQRLAHVIWRVHYPAIIAHEQIDYMLARGYAIDALGEFVDRTDRGLELALAGGSPAGFAAWHVTDDPGVVKLDKLYVLPAHQRRGLGGQLIGRVIGFARTARAATLILNVNKSNRQAIRAYERYGFRIRDAVVSDIGNGFVMDDYVMARSVGLPDGLPPSPPDATIRP
jgi:ribosomal protein S18 acetylase RimI-like enzyme